MEFVTTKLNGIYLIKSRIHEDNRGYFMESYNAFLYRQHNIDCNFIQDNHSLSITKGIIRGLHYQLNPKAQSKLIRVISGSIFDVVVDIRKNSSTFGQWLGTILSKENRHQLLIPPGFAHGFCSLEANTEVLYKVDEYYSPEHDRGILWNDPALGIDWPTSNPILSDKDQKHPLLKDAEINFLK